MGRGLSWTVPFPAVPLSPLNGHFSAPTVRARRHKVAEHGVCRLAAALSARQKVKAFAATRGALLESQGSLRSCALGHCHCGVRINNGGYSCGSSVNDFALAGDCLARMSAALAL